MSKAEKEKYDFDVSIINKLDSNMECFLRVLVGFLQKIF